MGFALQLLPKVYAPAQLFLYAAARGCMHKEVSGKQQLQPSHVWQGGRLSVSPLLLPIIYQHVSPWQNEKLYGALVGM